MSPVKAPEALLARIRTSSRFLLTSHVNPDGDAIGSAVGLAAILRRLGKSATVWSRDAVPEVYRPLPGSEDVHCGETPPPGFPDRFDAAVVLECPSLSRTGLEEALTALPLANVDHHLGNELYGEVDWIDSCAAAVGEMVLRLARQLGAELDADIADALYLALVTDTGSFRYSNATPEAFETAADLVRCGASPERVSGWLFESQPAAAMLLLGEMLRTLELHRGGRVATVWLKREMSERAGARPGDTEGLIDYPRSIAGVESVALFRQLGDGGFKVSLRSRGAINVEKVARRFGGGGHRNAAGFSRSNTDEDSLYRETLDSLLEAST